MNTMCKPYVLSIGAIIHNNESRILLMRRAETSKHFKDQWEPPGGKLAPGEAVEHAVLREVKEETQLEVVLEKVAGCGEFELPHLRVAVLYFHARVLGGELALSPEHSAYRWADAEALSALPLSPGFKSFLEAGGSPFSRDS